MSNKISFFSFFFYSVANVGVIRDCTKSFDKSTESHFFLYVIYVPFVRFEHNEFMRGSIDNFIRFDNAVPQYALNFLIIHKSFKYGIPIGFI